MLLPKLYKKSSSGAVLQWQIQVVSCQEGDGPEWGCVTTFHGQVGGAIQSTNDIIREGKNLNRANATTALEQARAEAQSRWEKQKSRKGYVESLERAKRGENDQASPVLAMLAHRYDKYPQKIAFPCYGQPKLDGLRCIAVVEDGEVELYSREGKVLGLGLTHLRRALSTLPNCILDGELFSTSVPFEQIVSFVKSSEEKPGNEVVDYHCYDLPSAGDKPFAMRTALLGGLLRKAPACLKFVETLEVTSIEVEPLFARYKLEGYEGLMLRNSAGLYKAGKRSYDLQKVKFTSDAPYEEEDFQIVGVKRGRGKLAECAIFCCETDDGQPFDVKMKGELDALRPFLTNAGLWQGKLLTVVYQELTAKGIPRFPVGQRVREKGL